MDAVSAAYIAAENSLLVGGLGGDLAKLTLAPAAGEPRRLTLQPVSGVPTVDFTTMAALSDEEVLVGTSDGRIFSYQGGQLVERGALSEFEEPVLGILVGSHGVWATGGRGLLAYSPDGHAWQPVAIETVQQPTLALPDTHPGSWYFGVANVDPESLDFTAFVDGKPALADTDYTFYPDEGFIQINRELDANPAPTIRFDFTPGPPFRRGDVAWNTAVEAGGGLILAGEFGLILQSPDNGKHWIRRNATVYHGEQDAPYWLTSTASGQRVVLAGAAGAITASDDGGSTWHTLPSPGKEGIFGTRLLPGGDLAVAGAVGLAGLYSNNSWRLADRSQLHVLSWLRNLIALPDGTWLMLGGRSTLLHLQGNQWKRLQVSMIPDSQVAETP